MLKTGLGVNSPPNPFYYIVNDKGSYNKDIAGGQVKVNELEPIEKINVVTTPENNFNFNELLKWSVIALIVYYGYIFLKKGL